MVEIKACSLCGQPKPLSEFHRRTRSQDGHQAHCKACGRVAWDQADARARARQHGIVTTAAELQAAIEVEAGTVVDVLFTCAKDGVADVLDRLAEALCGPDCPAQADDYPGEPCLLHLLGCIHADELLARVPAAVQAMALDWQPALPNR